MIVKAGCASTLAPRAFDTTLTPPRQTEGYEVRARQNESDTFLPSTRHALQSTAYPCKNMWLAGTMGPVLVGTSFWSEYQLERRVDHCVDANFGYERI
jgi:hypothetical protein